MNPKKALASLALMLAAGSASEIQPHEATTSQLPGTLSVAAFQAQLFEGSTEQQALMALSDAEMKETRGAHVRYLARGYASISPFRYDGAYGWNYWNANLIRLFETLRSDCSGIQCVPFESRAFVFGLHRR